MHGKGVNQGLLKETFHPLVNSHIPTQHFKSSIKKNKRKYFFQQGFVDRHGNLAPKVASYNKACAEQQHYPSINLRP